MFLSPFFAGSLTFPLIYFHLPLFFSCPGGSRGPPLGGGGFLPWWQKRPSLGGGAGSCPEGRSGPPLGGAGFLPWGH